ncbi:Thiamine pathway transporter THI73 [Meyerozyma sp. JA9]|nr:Thiamine pathway transporter THI73 [Meyerozyma sp. JA9]
MSDQKQTTKFDAAYEFVQVNDVDSELEPAANIPNQVYRRVDWVILPLLCGIYFLQFLDKSLLNYAAVMGIKDNLHGNQFSNLGTILYVAYIVFEPISAYCFQVLPPAKFFAFCVTAWGVVVTLHTVCTTYASLMVIRALLGCFEACVAPGCIIITGMWYSHRQQLTRMGFWSIQAGTSTILGGLLSFAFQHVDSSKTSLDSWQIFFLVMGLITVVFGAVVFVYLPNNPLEASFLDDAQKKVVLHNIRENETGTENKTFKKAHLYELFFHDKHTWPMFVLTLITMIPTGSVITFSVTIIASFGYSNKHAALMQMPVGVSTIISILGATYLCSYFNGKHRSHIFVSLLVPAIIGYIVMLSSTNKIGNLLAVYLINVGTCVITMIYAWNSKNTAGYTKRLARNCLTMIAFAVGCLIGPQLFRAGDAPHYRRAKITLLVLSAVSIPLVYGVGYISKVENEKRDRVRGTKEEQEWYGRVGENFQFQDLTDVENIHFRYSY